LFLNVFAYNFYAIDSKEMLVVSTFIFISFFTWANYQSFLMLRYLCKFSVFISNSPSSLTQAWGGTGRRMKEETDTFTTFLE
jgi:hypothetical protein